MGRKLGDWGREASEGPKEEAGDWEEDKELQEAVQRSLRDLAGAGEWLLPLPAG